MNIIDLLDLGREASNGKDYIVKGVVGFAKFGFVFISIENLLNIVNLHHTTGFYHISSVREYLSAYGQDKIRKFKDFLDYKYKKTEDLYYVGALKTLVPSLEFGGDELLSEVGLIVNTPQGKLFTAMLYWGKSGLTIGVWQRKLLGNIIGFKDS
ncbi:MAG: hypothetical protein ACFFHD_14940, partial [Promethearchaeota archaeon]